VADGKGWSVQHWVTKLPKFGLQRIPTEAAGGECLLWRERPFERVSAKFGGTFRPVFGSATPRPFALPEVAETGYPHNSSTADVRRFAPSVGRQLPGLVACAYRRAGRPCRFRRRTFVAMMKRPAQNACLGPARTGDDQDDVRQCPRHRPSGLGRPLQGAGRHIKSRPGRPRRPLWGQFWMDPRRWRP